MVVPLCRCRVLYIGSAVPTITKDGLQGIQQPLKERYPIDESTDTKGIDSWLSVWSNGVLLEYIDGDKKSETSFHPINTLHYCAAVRYVNVTGYAVEGGGERFLPLDSPFANLPDSPHPPIFAAIFRRTTGVKVLECHAFICTNTKAANALVRCCFHAYADSIYLKMDDKIPGLKAIKEASRSNSPHSEIANSFLDEERGSDKIRWSEKTIGKQTWERRQQSGDYETASISSSMAGRYRNKPARDSLQQEQGKALVPYTATNGPPPRRAGSDVDLHNAHHPHPHHMPPYMPPPPGAFYGPGPPMFHPHFGPPPPPPFHHPMMRHHPPHWFGGRLPPPPPPHMMPHPPPPPWGMMPPPPPGVRLPPPPPFFHPMFFYGPPPPMGRPHSPPDDGGGPIIEAVYGTLPSRGRSTNPPRAFEEPIYMGGNNPPGPPHASYHPASYPPEHYDAYMDTYKRHRSPPGKHKVNGSLSHRSGDEASASNQYWDSYEAGIYRKPHINEKAFGTSVRTEAAAGSSQQMTTQADVVRPDTPPADYEGASFDQLNISHNNNESASSPGKAVPGRVY